MDRTRRDRLASYVLLPLVLIAIASLAYFTFRTTLQLEHLRQESVIEATLGLAREKADRLDRVIIDQDNVVATLAEPDVLTELNARWLPTARRETPTVRAVMILDDTQTVIAFASRAGGSWTEEEGFRRLLTHAMIHDMELGQQPLDQLRHLHREYNGQSYLVSYWQRQRDGRRFVILAWHDIGRIVKDVLPQLYAEGAASPASRVNVVDEQARIIFGPPLRTGEFTVGVKFPTTVYNWRLQVSPAAGEELASRVHRRRQLELVMVVLSCVVIVAGVMTILVVAERQRRISALKSDFVANVSHELKTPLALVRMFAEMLQSGRVASDEKRREYLDIIVQESERLSALIENVLDFAKVERGRAAYTFLETDMAEAVRRAVNIYRYRADREGVALSLSIDDDLPRIVADERAVQLALINLIDNALKYAPGSETISVVVTRRGHAIELRVTDRGPGVAPEDRQRIFERFVRGEGAQKSSVRGSGIGLALVKQIVEGHGGRVWVEGEPGQGSTFVMEFPMRSSVRLRRATRASQAETKP